MSKPETPRPSRHPVVVPVDLDTGRIVIQAAESQVRALEAALARRGLSLPTTSRGLCG
jgi:hypothetical protein